MVEEGHPIRGHRHSKNCLVLHIPGFSSEMLHLFLATDLTPGTGQPDDDENIRTYYLSRETVERMIENGEICDAKTLLGLATVISRGLL